MSKRSRPEGLGHHRCAPRPDFWATVLNEDEPIANAPAPRPPAPSCTQVAPAWPQESRPRPYEEVDSGTAPTREAPVTVNAQNAFHAQEARAVTPNPVFSRPDTEAATRSRSLWSAPEEASVESPSFSDSRPNPPIASSSNAPRKNSDVPGRSRPPPPPPVLRRDGHDHAPRENAPARNTFRSGRSERRYNCELCSGSFERRGHLTEHIETVHNRLKRHACSICGRMFGHSSSLSRHVTSVHEPH